jgi:hypothetical protein
VGRKGRVKAAGRTLSAAAVRRVAPTGRPPAAGLACVPRARGDPDRARADHGPTAGVVRGVADDDQRRSPSGDRVGTLACPVSDGDAIRSRLTEASSRVELAPESIDPSRPASRSNLRPPGLVLRARGQRGRAVAAPRRGSQLRRPRPAFRRCPRARRCQCWDVDATAIVGAGQHIAAERTSTRAPSQCSTRCA